MSVQASILIEFSNFFQDPKKPTDFIKILLDGGWTFNDYRGISYLPIGDDGDFDWIIQSKISQPELIQILKEKEERRELVGVVLTWQDTNIGGSFLFYSSDKISISLNINRKILYGLNNFKMTDGNWYLERLLPLFYQNNIDISHFSFEELA